MVENVSRRLRRFYANGRQSGLRKPSCFQPLSPFPPLQKNETP